LMTATGDSSPPPHPARTDAIRKYAINFKVNYLGYYSPVALILPVQCAFGWPSIRPSVTEVAFSGGTSFSVRCDHRSCQCRRIGHESDCAARLWTTKR
jgi:hypothetical protein